MPKAVVITMKTTIPIYIYLSNCASKTKKEQLEHLRAVLLYNVQLGFLSRDISSIA